MNIRLPNGKVVRGIPDGTSDAEVKQAAIANGWAQPEDFPDYDPMDTFDNPISGTGAEAQPDPVLQWAKENPAEAGATVAGLATAPFSIPLGIAAGSVGAFAGEMIGQATEENRSELDWAEGFIQAGTAAGLDVATLGLGKFVAKPLAGMAGTGLEKVSPKFKQFMDTMRAAGKTPEQAANEVAELGTDESFRRTQKFLSDRGATLTPGQFPDATKAQVISENISNAALGGTGVFAENLAKVNQAVNKEFEDLFVPEKAMANLDIGNAMTQIITSGKQALGATYRKGLDEISPVFKRTAISGKPIAAKLQAYLDGYSTIEKREVLKKGKPVYRDGEQVLRSAKYYEDLPEDAVSLIKGSINDLKTVVEMPTSNLIDRQKALMDKIAEMSDMTQTTNYKPKAAAKLSEFSRIYREAVAEQLKRVDPKAAAAFKDLNSQYADGLATLLPPINKSFVTRADKDAFEGLGKILTSTESTSNAQALLNSLRKAYSVTDKAELENLPFKSADEAIDAIRSSYIQKTVSDLGGEFSVEKYANLANKFKNKDMQAKAKAVLGDKYVPFRDLLNVMSQAGAKPSGNIGQLAIRTQEYQSLRDTVRMGQGILGAGGVGAAGSAAVMSNPFTAVGAAVGAAAIFGVPRVIAKAATNPKYVNKLKLFENTKFKTADEMMAKFAVIADDIMAEELKDYYLNEENK
jgi:hypothetical protein